MYTTHGHYIPESASHNIQPTAVIECGGPGKCGECSIECTEYIKSWKYRYQDAEGAAFLVRYDGHDRTLEKVRQLIRVQDIDSSERLYFKDVPVARITLANDRVFEVRPGNWMYIAPAGNVFMVFTDDIAVRSYFEDRTQGSDIDELCTALLHTVEYADPDGTVLKAEPGWAWYDALLKHRPHLLIPFQGEK